jgi:hypothetical protein
MRLKTDIVALGKDGGVQLEVRRRPTSRRPDGYYAVRRRLTIEQSHVSQSILPD